MKGLMEVSRYALALYFVTHLYPCVVFLLVGVS